MATPDLEQVILKGELEYERIVRCPDCKSTRLITDDHDELVCSECGRVVDTSTTINPGPDWRAFNASESNERAHAGAPTIFTRHDKGLGSQMSRKDKDAQGGSIPASNRQEIYRMRKWERRSKIRDAAERNIAGAMYALSKLASQMQLPRTLHEQSAVIYRNAAHKNLVRGRAIETVVAAAVYSACRRSEQPRTLDEVSAASGVPRRELGRTYRQLTKEFPRLRTITSSAAKYIPRFCTNLGLGADAQSSALDIIRQAESRELTNGKGPTGVAAAAIYMGSHCVGDARTQKEVAGISGVTEVTIRNRYKELSERLGIYVTVK